MEVEMQHQHHQKTRSEGGRKGIVLDGECCQLRHSFAPAGDGGRDAASASPKNEAGGGPRRHSFGLRMLLAAA